MWTVRLEGVPEVASHTAVPINGKIYFFDPYCKDMDCTVRKSIDVYVFDPATYQWNQLQTQTLPDGSPWHSDDGRTVVAYRESAYLWSSRAFFEAGSVVYRFDTRTMAWSSLNASGQLPRIRCGQSACLVGSRVYLYGGWPLYGPSLPQIHFLDLETMQWHSVPTNGELPESRSYHSATAIGERMYVWGGCNQVSAGGVYARSLVFLDTSTLTWVLPRVHGRPPQGREDHSTFVYNGELYIFGGVDVDQGRYFRTIHKYSPEKSCWSVLTPKRSGPSARRFPGCCVIEDRVFIFGGRGLESNARVEQQVESAIDETSAVLEVGLTDMHVLNLCPTLRTMCLMAVIDAGVHVSHLPPAIKKEMIALTSYSSTSSS
ncbi:kelch domain-containing protein 3-like [Amblyomma americanum]